MKHTLLKLHIFILLLLLLGLVPIAPVQAGDPDKTIGPPDTDLLVCTYNHLIVPVDSDAFEGFSEAIFTFNPEIKVDAKQLKRDCKEMEQLFRDYGYDFRFKVEYARQTRIEGYVFEFHPDPNSPGGWMAVRSRDVPVVASGPGFEIVWGSEKDGQFFFDNLGAGPITLNLRLPPDAHPINPDIIVMSRSFLELWEVDLGFYRGDIPPEYTEDLRLPLDHKRTELLPPNTIIELDEKTGIISYMPNVGGVLPQNQPISTIILAAVVLATLPAVGFFTLRRKQVKD